MSNNKEKRKMGYPFSLRSSVKEEEKEEEKVPKSPPRYGVYKKS